MRLLKIWKELNLYGWNDSTARNIGNAMTSLYKDFCFTLFGALKIENVLNVLNKVSLYYDPQSNTLGYFSPYQKSININLNAVNILEVLRFISTVNLHSDSKPISSITHNATYVKSFAPCRGKAVTLIHELEHARRNSDHKGEGSHTQGQDAYGNIVHYDACANSYGQKAFANGHVEEWVKKVKNHIDEELRKTFDNLRQWDLASQHLNDLEKNHKKFLLKKLGIA